MTNAIEASGLVKHFGTTTALAGVDLAARQGTVLGVLGPNGAGKTTAVRILATLLQADSGTARVSGYDVVRDPQKVRQNIGLTVQYASVDEDLTGTQTPAGSTVLPTTQYLDEADALADEITVIDHGRVIAHDTPDGLKRIVGGQHLEVRPADPARLDDVRRILGEIASSTPVSSGR